MRKLLEVLRYCGWVLAGMIAYTFGTAIPATSYLGNNGQIYHNPSVPFNIRAAFISGTIVLMIIELTRAFILKITTHESIYSNFG